MIIGKYILRQLSQPLFAAVAVLAAVFFCYALSKLLSGATTGKVHNEDIAPLLLLQTLTAGEVLLPTAFYVATLMTLSRFYHNSEMVAFFSLKVGEMRIFRTICYAALAVSALTATLSLAARPWAYSVRYQLEYEASQGFDSQNIKAGEFFTINPGGFTVNADDVDSKTGQLKNIFAFSERPDGHWLLNAREGQIIRDSAASRILLEDGFAQRWHEPDQEIEIYSFTSLEAFGEVPPPRDRRNHPRTKPLLELLSSEDPKDVAERQWRLSMPIAALLLGMLAVPVSRVTPRSTKLGQSALALTCYALTFNLASIAHSWVGKGLVPTFPGMYWVWALLGLLVWALLRRPLVR